jgi:hypothetical protein
MLESCESTALLLVEPLNDVISEGGKLWPYLKEPDDFAGWSFLNSSHGVTTASVIGERLAAGALS